MVLYKYYPDNVYSYRAISLKGLWCHYPKNMNDPFECLGYSDRQISKNQIDLFKECISDSDNATLKKLRDFPDDLIVTFINQQRKEFINRFAFCSLSEGYDDIKMWSHYASSHTGFVIGFEFKESEIDHHFQKVNYVNELPEFDVTKLAFQLKGDYQYLDYFLADISIKSIDWKEEKEYRIWRNQPIYYHYKIENIQNIFFGINCKLETKAIVAKLLYDLPKDFQFADMEFADKPLRLKY